MSARQLAAVAAVGAAAWALWRLAAGRVPGTSLQPPLALSWGDLGGIFGPSGIDPADYGGSPPPATLDAGGYEAAAVSAESGGDLLAKNPRSSASGLYQFTKATWEKLGGTWGPDPSKPFGGLTPSAAEQQARFDALTKANGDGLARAGISATNAALYAAHVLGLPTALRVLTASPSTNLAGLVGSAVMAANPQFKGFTVANFLSWAGGRV